MLARKANAGVLAAALALCCALPATASGAATVGRTFTPGADVCTPASTYVTAGSPSGYARRAVRRGVHVGQLQVGDGGTSAQVHCSGP